MIGGGKRKPTGRIDIALIQSLVRNAEVSDLVGDYGHLIVDECHHLSAVSFELVARRSTCLKSLILGFVSVPTPITQRDKAYSLLAAQGMARLTELRAAGITAPR